MTDASVGVTLPQFTDDPSVVIDVALHAERCGLDSVWLFDHLWPLSGGKERPILESWTTLAYLAEVTERITVGTLVTRSSLRHPALLAKMVATIASIAPGRLIVAIGSGDDMSRAENEAFGMPYWPHPERTEQLLSTARVLRSHLDDATISESDPYADIAELPASPTPATRPSLWLAGTSDEVLGAAAEVADGWNAWGVSPSWFAERVGTLRSSTRDVEATWGGIVEFGADASALPRAVHVGGSPAEVTQRFQDLVRAGAQHLIATFRKPSDLTNHDTLASVVKPALNA